MANSCEYYCYDSGFFGMGNTCSVTGEKKSISEDYYRRYCYADYNKRDCPLHKKYGPYMGSGCFITTVACEILSHPDNDKILNDLRYFRDTVLQQNKQYYDILKEYDVIGPVLAEKIWNDKNRKEIASGLYQNVLLPVHNLISDKNYEKAVEYYYIMTLMLVNYYGLKHNYNEIKEKDYNYKDFEPTKAGHGRRKIK